MDLQLKGARAIVTGATQGIGLSIARTLAAEGANVAICARTAANVERTVAELKSKGVNAIGDAVDVTQKDAYIGWIGSAAQRLGGLDVFVSNTTGTPTHAGEKGWELGFQTDIMAAVRGCEAALPHLKKSKFGSIVLIASISGVMSKALRAPGILAYGSCKAALIAYGAQLSKEVAKDGVRINMVSPGPIYFENGAWDHIRQRAPAVYQDAVEHCVIGRLGKPEDIADAVAFLASPRSGFTVGQNLHIDGGYMEHIAF
ncbi:MAG TPA: SDR family NAD(P)-dependent oxidoreductase [Steroidobacteraceae bacterium]|nr:SDR family NAD(P)-dependent oxidoreductase [Steroidobacteraceae bacterium]HUK02203.1 SDR family NAD(P)-dependent oxidoreductase [Steroidobacteraceae bacterium]